MEISIVPNFVIRKITDNSIQQINWNVLISTIIIILSALFIKLTVFDFIPHFCIIKKATGLPCPGCGIIRSISYLSEYRFIDSLRINPNGILILLGLVLQIPLRIIALIDEKKMNTVATISRYITHIIITTLLFFWMYQVIYLKF